MKRSFFLLAFLFLNTASVSAQIIPDRKVGEILGEVYCAKREMSSAVEYLNNMQVPLDKIANVQNYPEVVKGYQRAIRWC